MFTKSISDVGDLPTCSCPDFQRRQDVCKHTIGFVMLKVIGLAKENPLVFQRAYLVPDVVAFWILANQQQV